MESHDRDAIANINRLGRIIYEWEGLAPDSPEMLRDAIEAAQRIEALETELRVYRRGLANERRRITSEIDAAAQAAILQAVDAVNGLRGAALSFLMAQHRGRLAQCASWVEAERQRLHDAGDDIEAEMLADPVVSPETPEGCSVMCRKSITIEDAAALFSAILAGKVPLKVLGIVHKEAAKWINSGRHIPGVKVEITPSLVLWKEGAKTENDTD